MYLLCYPQALYDPTVILDRASSRKLGHACGITKKGQESRVKEHNCGILLLILPNLGHLKC